MIIQKLLLYLLLNNNLKIYNLNKKNLNKINLNKYQKMINSNLKINKLQVIINQLVHKIVVIKINKVNKVLVVLN